MTQDDQWRHICQDAIVQRLLASGCPRCRKLARGNVGQQPRSGIMTAHWPLTTPLLLLWTVLLATLSCVVAEDPRGAMALPPRQQDGGMLYPLAAMDEYEPKTAKLLEILRANQRVGILAGSEPEEDEYAEPLPEPLPISRNSKEMKRGSYMEEPCLSKFCNYGKKRAVGMHHM